MRGSFMGFWWFYFLAKVYLHFKGTLHLDFLWNLAFLVFLKIRLPEKIQGTRITVILRPTLNGVFAFLLFWHESWFPPIPEFLAFLGREDLPETGYIFRFLSGFFSPFEILAFVTLLVSCLFLQRYITLTPVVVLFLLVLPLRDYEQAWKNPGDSLTSFYRSETGRWVDFQKGGEPGVDFDILILHICSLGWDDVKAIGLEKDPFWNQFDVLLSRFNSVTSYSNPSALRLLRANCGQSGHGDLYRPVSPDCYLMDNLRRRGYETLSVFNHDGKYGGFEKELHDLGHLDPAASLMGLPSRRVNFEGSPIYDDYETLVGAWNLRQEKGSPRVALYYNTLTLHDGSHRSGDAEWWKRDRVEEFKISLGDLFSDTTRFLDFLKHSGRNVLIVFIPEHGMALQGDALQAPGLREIPLPRITLVPVGIKWIPKEGDPSPFLPVVVSKPTSYLAVASLLSIFLNVSPSDLTWESIEGWAASLPETAFVSENENARVVQRDESYFLEDRSSENHWVKIPASNHFITEGGPKS